MRAVDYRAMLNAVVAAQQAIDAPSRGLKVMTWAELDAIETQIDYLIDDVMAAMQPMVIGGASKTLKTSIMIAMAIAMATGQKLCGRWQAGRRTVTRPGKRRTQTVESWTPLRVGIISGESGSTVLKDTARRIAAAMGVTPGDAGACIEWSADLPDPSAGSGLSDVRRWVERSRLDVLYLDPAYLLFPGAGQHAANVMIMGAAIAGLFRVLQDTGATPCMLHHTSRGASRGKTGEPADLADLAMAGFPEVAAQWMLIARRQKYTFDGSHKLWLTIGGRAGHSSLVGLDIAEGLRSDPGGRRWEARVHTQAELDAAEAEQRETASQTALEEKVTRLRPAIIAAFGEQALGTELGITAIAAAAGCDKKTIQPVVDRMTAAGRACDPRRRARPDVANGLAAARQRGLEPARGTARAGAETEANQSIQAASVSRRLRDSP